MTVEAKRISPSIMVGIEDGFIVEAVLMVPTHYVVGSGQTAIERVMITDSWRAIAIEQIQEAT